MCVCVCVTTFIKNPNGRVSYSNKNCFLINLSVVCVTVFIETQKERTRKGEEKFESKLIMDEERGVDKIQPNQN